MILTQLLSFVKFSMIIVKHLLIMCVIYDLSLGQKDLCVSIRKKRETRVALLLPHLEFKQMELSRLLFEEENVVFQVMTGPMSTNQ